MPTRAADDVSVVRRSRRGSVEAGSVRSARETVERERVRASRTPSPQLAFDVEGVTHSAAIARQESKPRREELVHEPSSIEELCSLEGKKGGY